MLPKRIKTLGVVCLSLGFASLAYSQTSPDTLYRKLEVFSEVITQIENHYVDVLSPTKLIYGAIRGVVEALDPHSAFFEPDEYKELISATEGEYTGIGVELTEEDGAVVVMAVFGDSPAQKAGIIAGDKIVGVDGQNTKNQPVDLVHTRLRGPVGSKVTLSIQRRNRDDTWTYTLVRSWIRIAPIDHRSLSPGVEYVHIKTFARRVSTDLETILNHQMPNKGLVIDLRNNPGGLFDEAVAVCDLFLNDGPIVLVTGRGGQVLEKHQARGPRTQPAYKIAILVDGGSASAAEVVAGALHDRGRARLFGERTYGKGSVQSILDLSDGSGLKLTVAKYQTPSGHPIDGHGIIPDEIVAFSEQKDLALERASRWLQN